MKAVTMDEVTTLFAHQESGNANAFFQHVADDVDWTVMVTHPLADTYHDKQDFIASTFTRLNRVLRDGILLRFTHILVSDDTAAVELEALSTALNGAPFRNRYCWICRFDHGRIVEVRVYLDSALVQKLLEDNEPTLKQK